MKGTKFDPWSGNCFTSCLAGKYIYWLKVQGFNTTWSKQATTPAWSSWETREMPDLESLVKDGTDERLIWRRNSSVKICTFSDSIWIWDVRFNLTLNGETFSFLSLTSSRRASPWFTFSLLPPCPRVKSLDNSPRETESLRFFVVCFLILEYISLHSCISVWCKTKWISYVYISVPSFLDFLPS